MANPQLNRELQQEFRVWIESQKMKGFGAPDLSAHPSCRYVPTPRIDEYFKSEKIITQLLQRLDPDRNLKAHQGVISKDYPKVLCILIIIGQGHHIGSFVRHASLCDDRLPFEHKPLYFPYADNSEDFFEKFKEVQWQFCTEVLTYSMDRVYEDARILPIMTKDRIGGGASSHIFKITLPQAYDRLEPHGSSGKKNPSFRFAHTYALKTYRTSDAKSYYDNEVSAFRRVIAAARSQGLVPGLIGFHGNFTHADTHNVILEYADIGTLEQYFENYLPPTTEDDIVSFWEGLFYPIFALLNIHNLEGQDLANPDVFHGWHQDIKPQNILVVSGDRPSPYKYEFKLADLGLSHFKKPKSTNGEATDTDTYGTRTYGAPESYRCDSLVGPTNLRVTKAVDIWSLGCVYSEAAAWLVLGKDGLKQYRADRREETDSILNFKDDGSFHNGEKILESVELTHSRIVRCKRGTDHITRYVLQVLVQGMLAREAGERLTAHQLWARSKTILAQAKGERRQSSIWASSIESTPASRTPTHRDTFQEPHAGAPGTPQAPPGPASTPRSGTQLVTTEFVDEGGRLENSPLMIPEEEHDAELPPIPDLSLDKRQSKRISSIIERPRISQLPRLSVDAANLWKEEQKKLKFRARTAPEGGVLWMKRISKRDHVFIVDDSASMRGADWAKLTSRFSLLAYIVKVADPDGLDLYFSSSKHPIHSKRSSDLGRAVNQRISQPAGSENLRNVLEVVFQAFRASFIGSGGSKGFFGKRASKGKPMTCYILTDGASCLHENCNVEAVIRDFVNELLLMETEPKDFGIQFISFGGHEEGLKVLDHLDSCLNLERDIVDTEGADGNVWKMLLGSINKKFDDDGDDHFYERR